MILDTVLIRHLPSSITHQEKSNLLRHFGAVDVKIVGSELRKSSLAYARFESNKAAEVAVKKLHQLNVLGHMITAEIARGKSIDTSDEPVDTSLPSVSDEKQDRVLKARESFLRKLGLSIKNYDFSLPPPLNIYYQYPPPTRTVLENICKAMANTPHLYNQVLHLMNKMNLPCPFTDKYPMESDLFQEKTSQIQMPEKIHAIKSFESKPEESEPSEDESEIGSDSEQKPNEIIPMKRKRVDKKVIKRPKFLKPAVPPVHGVRIGLKADDVFESTQKEQVTKKIELNISANLSSIHEAKEIQATENAQEGFKVIKAPPKALENKEGTETREGDEVEETGSTFISAEELAANRISVKDQKVLPVFKSYQAGAPSCRLYIKNLAKQVMTRDLHFIYRRYYRPELDLEQGSMFDVRLMQEGRMKGQAFITLQNVVLAQLAREQTNGFILKDKPMVVQFARSAATK